MFRAEDTVRMNGYGVGGCSRQVWSLKPHPSESEECGTRKGLDSRAGIEHARCKTRLRSRFEDEPARRGRGSSWDGRLLGEEGFPAGPGGVAGFFVGFAGVGSFAGAHEAVAGAIVGDGVVGFAGGFHGGDSVGNGGADARVIAGVKTVDEGFDAGQVGGGGRRAVENESGEKIGTVGGEAESLSAAPAETGDVKFAARGRKLQAVIGGGVEIGGDLVGIQFADGFGDAFGEILGAAA